MVTEGALMSLLVLPIGIFRMLEIPQRPSALHLRNGCEVVCWRRRSRGPLERPCIPGIASGKLTPKVRPKQVANEHHHARRLKEHANCHDEIPDVPAASRLVGVDSARHPENAGNVHEIEGQMEPYDEKPKVQSAERLVVHSSRHLREPIIECSEQCEENAAHYDIVKVRDDEIRISELPIEWRGAQHDPGQACDQKLK